MNSGWAALLPLAIVSFFWAIAATKQSTKLLRSNVQLEDQVFRLKMAIAAYQIESQVRKIDSLTSRPMDDTTNKLIKLAVNNANDHEARTAALQACKRIHKKLNG